MHFIINFIFRSLAGGAVNFLGAILLAALGIKPELLVANPPVWLTNGWTQAGLMASAFCLIACAFYVQSRVEIAIPDKLKRRPSLTFSEIALGLNELPGLGLRREEVLHALLKALWQGDFESAGGNSRVWIPDVSGARLVGNDWFPVSQPSVDSSGEEMDVDVMTSPPPNFFNRRTLLVCCNMVIGDIYPTFAAIAPLLRDDARPWNDVKNYPNWDLLASIQPSQYGKFYVNAYLEN